MSDPTTPDLDTILLNYVNRPFGQAEAIECRDRIKASIAADLALAAAVPEFYQQRHNGRAECVICGGFKPGPGDTTGLTFGGHHQGCPFLTRGPDR